MRWPIVFQFFLAFWLFGMHGFLPLLAEGPGYSPFDFARSGHVFDESHFYAPPVARFQRFNLRSGDLDVFENRDRPGLYPQGPTVVLGAVAKIFGNLEWVWTVLHGLLPALFWLVTFRALRSQTEDILDRSLGAWAFAIVGMGPRFALLLSPDAFFEPPDLTRIPNPALSGLAFMMLFGALAKLPEQRHPGRYVALGIGGGLLFYLYPFYAITWFGMLAVLVAASAGVGDRRMAVGLISAGAIGVVTALPYLAGHFGADPEIRRVILARTSFATHAISWPGILAVLAGAWGTVLFLKKRSWFWALIFAAFAGAGLGMNAQVLTGFDAHHFMHYRLRVLQPFAVLALVMVAVRGWRGRTRKPGIAIGAATVLLISLLAYRQFRVASYLGAADPEAAPRLEMMRWARTLPEPTVFATTDRFLIALLPAVSGQWTFVPSNYRTFSSEEEILGRFVIAAKWTGGTLPETLALFRSPELAPGRSWTAYANLLLGAPTPLPRHERSITREWAALHPEKDGRRLDYVILDRRHVAPAWVAGRTPVFQNSRWSVYPKK